MPSCPSCQKHAHPEELRPVGDQLACGNCRSLRVVPSQEAKMDSLHLTQKAPGTKILDLQVVEVDGDHQISISIKLGSALFNYQVTVNRIREFFTKRRAET